MGIPGLYKYTGKLERVSLAKLAADHFQKHSRKLRIAIDASIWLFQAKTSLGGANPVLRTIYFRLLRLLRLGIDPIFVFDGPGRPKDKRNKKINASWESRHAKQLRALLDLFGFIHHNAPGEAEAECAFLQREGFVDIVFSEDGDTLMFGATVTIRKWESQEKRGSKVPTHVDIIYAKRIKSEHHLSREGMILIALMSGGDYDTVGIKGCGPTIAYEAAKAGFGDDLCLHSLKTRRGLEEWRERLKYELRKNESGFFGSKHPKVADTISRDFPCEKIVESYLLPLDSSQADLSGLKASIEAYRSVDIYGLRAFLGDKLEWSTRAGALKYIRGLAPGLLTSWLLEGDSAPNGPTGLLNVCGARTHASSDGIAEVKVEIRPIDLIPLDLEAEPLTRPSGSGSVSTQADVHVDSDDADAVQEIEDADSDPGQAEKRRAFKPYDPSAPEKLFIAECYVRHGALSRYEEWKKASELPKPKSPRKPRARKPLLGTGMKEGAIESFFSVRKGPLSLSSQAGDAKPDKPQPQTVNKRAKISSKPTTKASSAVNPWTMAKSTLTTPSPSMIHFTDGRDIIQSQDDWQNSVVFDAPAAEVVDCATSFDSISNMAAHNPGTEALPVLIDADECEAIRKMGSFVSTEFSDPISSQDFLRAESEIMSQARPKSLGIEKLKARVRESLPGAWAVETSTGDRHAPAALLMDEIVDLT